MKHTKKCTKFSFFLSYTLFFVVLALCVYTPYLLTGKTFIWKPDGLTQHYNALVYIGSWGRSILHTLLSEHRLSVPLWDFSLGYGSDILTTLHYYVIGDPLNLLAIFTPVRYMELLYCSLILLRLYLAGLAFASYCFFLEKKGTAVLAGSLAYVFCGYSLTVATMHPYFINPMIYLPLLLTGVEKVFQKKSPHLLIAMTALSALSNFYFFYMIVILTVLYCVIRFCTTEHENWLRELAASFGKICGASLLGTILSAGILLPILLQFFGDSRSQTELPLAASYGSAFYQQFLDAFLSTRYSAEWTFLAFTPLILLCIFLLFLKRNERSLLPLKLGFLLLTACLLLPAAGSLFNGFSYAANRWSFGYSFLVSFILVTLWPDLVSLSKRERLGLFLLSLACLTLLLLMPEAGSPGALLSCALLFIILLLSGILSGKWLERSLLLLLSLSVCSNAFFLYRGPSALSLNRFVNLGEGLSELEHTSAGMMSLFYPDDGTFYRCAQDPVPLRNDYLNYHQNTIQYYWSLSNGSITRYFNELAVPFHERTFKYSDLNYRAGLHALAGVRYYVRHDPNDYLPYPYANTSFTEYLGDLYAVSETDCYLPFGYTSSHFLTRDTYTSLSYLQRQQALLQGILLEEAPSAASSLTPAAPVFQEQALPFTISGDAAFSEENGSFHAAEDHTEVTLTFEGLPECETYLQIRGMQAEASADSSICRFPVSLQSELLDMDFSYYAGRTESSNDNRDFLINLGYSPSGQHTVTLDLPYAGRYSFDSLQIFCLPLADSPAQVDALREDVLDAVTFGTNTVTGSIKLDEEKLLCLSIPYSSGWSALVDGSPAPLLRADTMYMALSLTPGAHTIELHYQTPGLKAGLFLSLSGLVLWCSLHLILRRKRKAGGR